MAIKKKLADTSTTWIVMIDGNTPTEVVAETCELTEHGLVFCNADEEIVRAVAPGHWTTVELKPPADETPPA